MLVVLTNMSCDHQLWWSLTFSLDCNEEAIILNLVYLHIASTFRSTDPFSSTGDDHKNYRIYRHADDWNHFPFRTSAPKIKVTPPLLLPRPQAPPCCVLTLPLGKQVASFLDRAGLTTTHIGACRATLLHPLKKGMCWSWRRRSWPSGWGHLHACRNL